MVYQNTLNFDLSLNKKGRGFLLNWVVSALQIHYNKTISTKYLKQFIPFYDNINELEVKKDKLTKKIFKSKDLIQEMKLRKELMNLEKIT